MTIQTQITKAHRKLDKAIQQNRPPAMCEACTGIATVIHHYVQKSQSAYLRNHPKNHIQLCNPCHFALHTKSDPNIVARIIEKRGKEWEKWIQEHRSILIKRDKFYLQELEAKIEELTQDTF